MLDKPTVSLISVQCGYVEFIISSNETGVSPTLDYVIFTTSGGNVQTKPVYIPVVRINLEGKELYTVTISVRNKYGYSLVSDPLTLETSTVHVHVCVVELFCWCILYVNHFNVL